MSLYDATQQQRANERRIRALKRQKAGLEGAGQDTSEVNAKLRKAQAVQKDFCEHTGLKRDYFRERGGTQNQQPSPNPVASSTTYSTPQSQNNEILQKLNFADNVPEAERRSVAKELSVLPAAQREAAETQISGVRLINDTEPDIGSHYNPKTKEIVLSHNRKTGDIIHEYGHALERALRIWKDPEYISIRAAGIDLADEKQIVYDETTFTQRVYLLKSDKFVSKYQGHLYTHGEDVSIPVDPSLMKDYFSEGYRAYYSEPWLLRKKDPLLYDYIGGVLNDKR